MPSSLRGRWPSKQAKNSSRLSFRAPSTSFSTSCQLKRSNSKNIRMARMANYIEMQLASKKNNMGQTSEGCQSLEFGDGHCSTRFFNLQIWSQQFTSWQSSFAASPSAVNLASVPVFYAVRHLENANFAWNFAGCFVWQMAHSMTFRFF